MANSINDCYRSVKYYCEEIKGIPDLQNYIKYNRKRFENIFLGLISWYNNAIRLRNVSSSSFDQVCELLMDLAESQPTMEYVINQMLKKPYGDDFDIKDKRSFEAKKNEKMFLDLKRSIENEIEEIRNSDINKIDYQSLYDADFSLRCYKEKVDSLYGVFSEKQYKELDDMIRITRKWLLRNIDMAERVRSTPNYFRNR